MILINKTFKGRGKLKFIKRLLCKHTDTYTITNFYGDAINQFGCRSWKICKECGKIIKDGLDKECKRVNELYYNITAPKK